MWQFGIAGLFSLPQTFNPLPGKTKNFNKLKKLGKFLKKTKNSNEPEILCLILKTCRYTSLLNIVVFPWEKLKSSQERTTKFNKLKLFVAGKTPNTYE